MPIKKQRTNDDNDEVISSKDTDIGRSQTLEQNIMRLSSISGITTMKKTSNGCILFSGNTGNDKKEEFLKL